jgi:chlorophyll synthase
VLHPFPSVLNAILVATLYVMARGSAAAGIVLGVGMLGLQFAIGAVNDLVDLPADSLTKPGKPIPAGYVGRTGTAVAAIVAAGVGLAVYAAWGPLLLGLAAGMLACGLAYDVRLKRAGLGWLCWAVAFPLLPLSTWFAATGSWPPRSEVLLPIAILAGPMLQLSNGIVDLERDLTAGVRGPAVRLGRSRSVRVLAVLVAVVYGSAWVTLVVARAVPASLLAAGVATCLGAAGILLSTRDDPAIRERGWQSEAAGLVLLAAAWLAAAT